MPAGWAGQLTSNLLQLSSPTYTRMLHLLPRSADWPLMLPTTMPGQSAPAHPTRQETPTATKSSMSMLSPLCLSLQASLLTSLPILVSHILEFSALYGSLELQNF